MERRNFLKTAAAALPLATIATGDAEATTATYFDQQAITPPAGSSITLATAVYTGEFESDDAYDQLMATHGDRYESPEDHPGHHIGVSESGDRITDTDEAGGLLTVYEPGQYILRRSEPDTLPRVEQTLADHVNQAGLDGRDMLASAELSNLVATARLDEEPLPFDTFQQRLEERDGLETDYDPDMFPALICRDEDSNGTSAMVFPNGKVVVPGAASMADAMAKFATIQDAAADLEDEPEQPA